MRLGRLIPCGEGDTEILWPFRHLLLAGSFIVCLLSLPLLFFTIFGCGTSASCK
jgi:hypothetical protein